MFHVSVLSNKYIQVELKSVSDKDSASSTDEIYGFFQCKFIMSYVIYLALFAMGWFTPHFYQLWLDFGICSLYALIIYCSKRISNKWILFLSFGWIHSILHYLYPFLDHNGLVIGITPFPDILCHTAMFVFAVWFLGFGQIKDFLNITEWNNVSIYFKIFWVISVFGSALNIVSSLLIYEEDTTHFDEAVIIFEYTSIFQAISTGFCWSASIVNPLTCKSEKLIKYHLIPWVSGAIITWFIFLFDNTFMDIMVDHGYLQFLLIYPVIAALTVHFFMVFVNGNNKHDHITNDGNETD